MTAPRLLAYPRYDSWLPPSSLLLHWRAAWAELNPLSGLQSPTFLRASVATALDANGYLRRVANHQTRYEGLDLDGDGIGEYAVLRLDAGESSGWSHTEQLDHANWTKTGATISANATSAPDLASTADKIAEDTANSDHGISRNTPALGDNQSECLTFFAQAAERNWLRIVTTNKANQVDSSWVNISTGATGTVDAQHTVRVRALANGWYRIAVVWNSGSGATTPSVAIRLATANNATTYAGTSGAGAFVWGINLAVGETCEVGYIPAAASAVTTQPDEFTLPAGWGLLDSCTVYVEAERQPWAGASGSLTRDQYLVAQRNGALSGARLGLYAAAASRVLTAAVTDAVPTTQTVTVAMPSTPLLTVAMQARNLLSAPQVRLGTAHGVWSAWSTAVAAFPNIASQVSIGDSGAGAGNNWCGGLGVVKMAAGLLELADMQRAY